MNFTRSEQQVLDEVTGVLRHHFEERVSQIVLFGSRARRDHQPNSDYDLLVVLKDEKVDTCSEQGKILDAIFEIDVRNRCLVSCLPVSKQSFERKMTPLMINARREGVVV